MIVVSTGFNPPDGGAKCIDSVEGQTFLAKHFVQDAARQVPPWSVTANLSYMLTAAYDPWEVVVWLDLDDWLAHSRVLEFIAGIYKDPNVWLTYGSYRCADGRPGHCSEYLTEDFRGEPWKASHLRTFRAGLFWKIAQEDLRTSVMGGSQGCPDLAVMLPMLEMCGKEHSRYIPEVLAIYNYASSFEHGAKPEEMAHELRAAEEIRGRKRYTKLERLV